jgi:hypothetical protein
VKYLQGHVSSDVSEGSRLTVSGALKLRNGGQRCPRWAGLRYGACRTRQQMTTAKAFLRTMKANRGEGRRLLGNKEETPMKHLRYESAKPSAISPGQITEACSAIRDDVLKTARAACEAPGERHRKISLSRHVLCSLVTRNGNGRESDPVAGSDPATNLFHPQSLRPNATTTAARASRQSVDQPRGKQGHHGSQWAIRAPPVIINGWQSTK